MNEGELNGNAICTEALARRIISIERGCSGPRGWKAKIARENNLSKATVTAICKGERWGWLWKAMEGER